MQKERSRLSPSDLAAFLGELHERPLEKISGKKVIEEYRVSPDDLVNLILQRRLNPENEAGIPVFVQDSQNALSERFEDFALAKLKELRKNFTVSLSDAETASFVKWIKRRASAIIPYPLPTEERPLRQYIRKLESFYFKVEEVDRTLPTILRNEWDEKIAAEARQTGFINSDHLAYLLAKDEHFTRLLPAIWHRFAISRRSTLDLSTPQARVGACLSLVDTWLHGDMIERRGINPMHYKPSTAMLCSERRGNPALDYVALADLEEFMCKHLMIVPPLPHVIFVSEVKEVSESLSPGNVEKIPDDQGTRHQKSEEENGDLLYPTKVLNLIKDAKSEIEMIWNGFRSVQRVSPQEIFDDVYEWYKDSALRYYNEIGESKFKIVKREHLEDEHLYYYGKSERPSERHLKRDFIGKLYQILIYKSFPEQLPEPLKPPARYGVKKLYRLHTTQD